MQVIEQWHVNDFNVVFRHNFSNFTSRQCEYNNSDVFLNFLKTIMAHTDK